MEYCKDSIVRKFYEHIKYRVYRSFFWNVTYKLISDYYNLGRSSIDWSKKMVWSNLYKIAPDGKNPDFELQKIQQTIAFELVKLELDEIKPNYCIVITNYDWWQPFHKWIKTEIIPEKNLPSEIITHERYNNTSIIVTNRPRFGNSDEFVRQILSLIKKE